MTTTETFIASQARKAQAGVQVKNAEPRRAEDDGRFTEELRTSRAEEARQAEERARDRRAEEARAEDTRKAEARDAARADNARAESARAEEARAQEAQAEEARAEDARAEKAQEEEAREERASDSSGDSETAAVDGNALKTAEETTVQQAVVTPTITGAEKTATPQDADTVTADAAEQVTIAARAASAEDTAASRQATAVTEKNARTASDVAAARSADHTPATAAAAKTAGTRKPDAAPARADTTGPGTPLANRASSTDTQAAQARAQTQAASTTSTRAALAEAPSAPVEAETLVAARTTETAGKRGLGHAAAEAMQDAKSDARPKASISATPQAPDASPADRNTASAQTFQRSSASEIALQAVMAKATGTPQDIRVAGLESTAGTAAQSADGAAPAPSVTIRAIAAATSLPGTPVQPQTPAREIAINMARNLTGGTSRFEIRLDPAELGRIDVRMELGADGRVQAHLTVEKPETLDMLQRDARALEKALSDAGLDMENGSLGYSLRDDSEQADFTAKRETADDSSGTSPSEDDLTADLAAVQHIYALKAGSGSGVDIRI